MADYRRQKANISKRDWSSKTKKQNISYIKKKLKEYGLDIPKYLTRGELSARQIQSNVNKIKRAMDKHIDVQRQENTKANDLYNKIRKAEANYRKSYKNSNPLEKEVFLNNKTAQFLDKDSITSPMYFHNFKNISQFKKLLSAMDKDDREQYLTDYLNQLENNNYSKTSTRLNEQFKEKLDSFYAVEKLNRREIKNHTNFIDLFKSLDYVRQMEMLNIMDNAEYQQMVESLIKKGYSEPLALELALKNLDFRPNSEYSILE